MFITAVCFLSCLFTHLISSLSSLITTLIVLNQKFPFSLLKKLIPVFLHVKWKLSLKEGVGRFAENTNYLIWRKDWLK